MALPYDLTTHDRTKIGLIVLQADESIEHDMRRMMPFDVDLLVSRVPSGTKVSSDSLAQMASKLTSSAGLFPADAHFATIGYGCTSGTAEIGAQKISKLIRDGAKTDTVTQPVSGLIAACHALEITRIGLISPYIAQVSDKLRLVLQDAGITVTTFASFNEAEERRVVRIAPHAIKDAAIAMGQSGTCDAVFLSCTNLRTLDVIDDIEAAIGMPVLASNQVLAWDMLRLAGASATALRPGRLWAAV